MEQAISQGRKTPDETRAAIVAALWRDPFHNASRVAKQFGVSCHTVWRFAKADGIPLLARSEGLSEGLSRLWADPEWAAARAKKISEGRRRGTAASQARKTPDETRAAIVAALWRDPFHNASNIARRFRVPRETVRNFAKADGIPLLARSEGLSRRWADPEWADALVKKIIEGRRRRTAAKRLQKLNHD